MYILEIIARILKNRRKSKKKEQEAPPDYFCEHLYLPIDSAAEYLACNKCGHVIKNNK